MAKLSDRQKDSILARWNTGEFNKSELARYYKVSEKTVRNIIGGNSPANADIVDIGVKYELLKKSEKSPSSVTEIERAVKSRIDTMEADNELVVNNRKLLKGMQSSITSKMMGRDGKITRLEANEIKSLTGAIKDIENIANPKESGTKVDVTTNILNVPTMEDLYK